MNKHTFIIILEFVEKATLLEKLDLALKGFCILIYIIAKIILDLMKTIFEYSYNGHNYTSIQQFQTQIHQLKTRVEDLRVRIAWTMVASPHCLKPMDYVQLTKQGKDTSYLQKFREQLEQQFYDANTDPDKNTDPPSHE